MLMMKLDFNVETCGTVYFLVGNGGIDDKNSVIDKPKGGTQPDWCGQKSSKQQAAWQAESNASDTYLYLPDNKASHPIEGGLNAC